MSTFYLDNTLFHRLLPLANGQIPNLVAGRIPGGIARALEALLLSDDVLLNPLEPPEIHAHTDRIVSWLGSGFTGPRLDLETLTLDGQRSAAERAAAEMLALIQEAGSHDSILAVIPSMDTILASWREAVPEGAGRSDWEPLWSLLGEPLAVREEQAARWLDSARSGKLLFASWCSDPSMWDTFVRNCEWLRTRTRDELDSLHLVFFVLLNQQIARQQGATYSSTDTRMRAGQDAQSSLYWALCSRLNQLRREVIDGLGHNLGTSPTSGAPACPIGLIDVAISRPGDRSVPVAKLGGLMVDFWATKEMRDLRGALSRLGRVALGEANDESVKATLLELRGIEEGVRRRLGISEGSRALEIEPTKWRGMLLTLLQEPSRPIDALRQELVARSPRVSVLARAVASPASATRV